MNPICFRPVTMDLPEGRDLFQLNYEIFPDDAPPDFGVGQWFIGWDKDLAVAFCGWKMAAGAAGFHYRAGVTQAYRGRRLQAEMIGLRERVMRAANLKTAVTYTETYSAASMATLIGCGYRPYEVTEATALAPADRWRRMVHWRKTL